MKAPLKMKSNRVWRIYKGGKLLERFCGLPHPADGCYPEDWLASVVEANNLPREGKPPHEGLCMVAGEEPAYLRDVIAADPAGCLGAEHFAKLGQSMGVLVKFLDSAERLPIQVHPDKEKAKSLFHSDYGKTEAWYILDGREIGGEKPYILMGFKEGVDSAVWEGYFDIQDIAAMENSLHKIEVQPGDVYLVRGGTPHAIGPGCFLLEIQEPTDYTISMEKTTPQGETVDDFMCHQGVGFEKMFACFHYDQKTRDEMLAYVKFAPRPVFEDEGAVRDVLISYEDTPAFALYRLRVFRSYVWNAENAPAILVGVGGCGAIAYGGGSLPVKKGESVFMPAGLERAVLRCEGEEPLVLLECRPPRLS